MPAPCSLRSLRHVVTPRWALGALPPRRREIFDLARFQALSYQEIADVLGISVQTVANWL